MFPGGSKTAKVGCMGIGMSLRIAPGVRLSASGSGMRASVGPRAARVHVGGRSAAVSTGFGPLTASSSTRRRQRTPAKPVTRDAPARKPPPSRADTVLAGLELATGIMMLIDSGLERRQAKQIAADSVQAAKLLTTVHLEDFPEATPPTPPAAPRRLNRLLRVDPEEQAALDEDYQKEVRRWDLLCQHDPDEVIATVDDALANNASQSACIDAGAGPLGRYVTVVVHYPGPEITQGIVQAGTTTRPRTDKEKNDLYKQALASTVVATAKETLARAPAATEAYVVVLRYDMRGRFKKAAQLDAIYAGAFERRALGGDWTAHSPHDVMIGARAAQINQDWKGRIQPLGDDATKDLRDLVVSISIAMASGFQNRARRRRFSRNESLKKMESQAREAFSATCLCPGCGHVTAHDLRAPRPGEPSWAEVIRRCAECDREWAQE